jgi:hypothetical protein
MDWAAIIPGSTDQALYSSNYTPHFDLNPFFCLILSPIIGFCCELKLMRSNGLALVRNFNFTHRQHPLWFRGTSNASNTSLPHCQMMHCA